VKYSEWPARSKQAACALLVNSAKDRRKEPLAPTGNPLRSLFSDENKSIIATSKDSTQRRTRRGLQAAMLG
jgi:hypothetical protein